VLDSFPLRPVAVALALAGALAPPAGARQVAEVQVVPGSLTLRAGERRPILATAFDAAGNVLAVRFTFTSSDTSVVAVDVTGALLARRPGLARVEARAGDRSGAVTVAVRGVEAADGAPPEPPSRPAAEPPQPSPAHPRVESLLLEPGPRSGPVVVVLGAIRQLTLIPKDSADSEIPGAAVGWESADSTIVRVEAGAVRGLSTGSTTVTARVQGFRPVVWEVRVVPADSTSVPPPR
jgi:hypothetical protein